MVFVGCWRKRKRVRQKKGGGGGLKKREPFFALTALLRGAALAL